MTTAENFALDQWLTDYPDDMSYADVLACMREPDNVWTCEHITVWQTVENFTLDQVAEFIDDTKNHFEIAIRGME